MRQLVISGILAALCAIGISQLQPDLAARVHKVKQRDDVALVPPPNELRNMSLGYRYAMADLLWADLVYQFGLHSTEHRAFPDVRHYIEAILALEPNSQSVYLYGDTLIMYRFEPATEEDALYVRDLMDRGTRERPYDPEVWLHAGQFEAFLAVSFLKNPAEEDEWRRRGALKIAHAVELGADPDRSLAASSILRKAGERDAALRLVQRTYAMSDDPQLRRQMLFKLGQLQAGNETEMALSAVERELRSRWGFLSRGEALLIGPGRGAASCAGPQSYTRPRCVRDWQQFVDEAR